MFKILLLVYADDTILVADSAQSLHNYINDFPFAVKHGISNLLEIKQKVTIFGPSSNRNFSFTFENTSFEIVNN